MNGIINNKLNVTDKTNTGIVSLLIMIVYHEIRGNIGLLTHFRIKKVLYLLKRFNKRLYCL